MSVNFESTIISTICTTIVLLFIIDYVILRTDLQSAVMQIKNLQDKQEDTYSELRYLREITERPVKRDEIIDIRNKMSDIMNETYRQYADIQSVYNEKLLLLRNFTDEQIKKYKSSVLEMVKRTVANQHVDTVTAGNP